ncbi:unnamed protein product [Cuscuta europaea]|uniref:Uncharacterized protein n=1 Tax=Cuscuta europaea TaxID=41803 RepID=A0A9P0Z7Q1_CUSEU|nr:unnamed protein product [Cuscuta europaea]
MILKLQSCCANVSGQLLLYYHCLLNSSVGIYAQVLSNDYQSLHLYSRFLYTSVCVGIAFCFVARVGHVGAVTTNKTCLASYCALMFSLILTEVRLFLNEDWREVFKFILHSTYEIAPQCIIS